MKALTFHTELYDLEHTYLAEHDIHIMTPRKSSRIMVDDFFKFLDDLYDQLDEDKDEVRIVLDYRQGLPPISYTIRKGMAWTNTAEIHPRASLAFLVKQDTMTQIFGTLLQTLRLGHLRSRFFMKDDALEDAIAWCKTSHTS